MSYCFHVPICLAAIILQTAIFPHLPLLDRCYDLMVPFAIYLGLYRPATESLVSLLLAGVLMDGLSGGAFGLYLTAYLWIYIGSVWLVRYLHLVNSVLLPFVAAGGVVLQNMIFFAGSALAGAPVGLNAASLSTVGVQFLLAVATGPFILLFLHRAHAGWLGWVSRSLNRRNGAARR